MQDFDRNSKDWTVRFNKVHIFSVCILCYYYTPQVFIFIYLPPPQSRDLLEKVTAG